MLTSYRHLSRWRGKESFFLKEVLERAYVNEGSWAGKKKGAGD